MELEFFLPMKSPPTTTFQDKKINWKTKSFYKSAEVKRIETLYREMLEPYKPSRVIEGPVRLLTKWCYPYPDNFTVAERTPTWKDTKPDTDNMVKLLKDQMTKTGFWKDDSQVVSEIIEKFYSEPTGIYISISKLEDI